MPYYYTKVSNRFKNISKNTLPTFMIDKLSSYMFQKETLCVAEWFQSIQNSMENADKIIQIILLQPGKKDEISHFDASFIIHLLPPKAIKSWLKTIKKEKNWEVLHDEWLERFEDEDEDEEEADDGEEDEDYNSDLSSDDDLSEDDDRVENDELDIMPEHLSESVAYGFNWSSPEITV